MIKFGVMYILYVFYMQNILLLLAISVNEKCALMIERQLWRFYYGQYKVAHSESAQLVKPTIQKQMRPDVRWIDTMYGYMDGCSGMM